MKILNLGCGNKISDEMINIDFVSDNHKVVRHNLLTALPYKTASVDMIYHSNVLEHFSQDEGKFFLKENFRVLKPGGVVRCVVPDLENVTREYLRRLKIAREGGIDQEYSWIKIELLDQLVRDEPGGAMAKFLSSDHEIPGYLKSRIGAVKSFDSYKMHRPKINLRRLIRFSKLAMFSFLGANYKVGAFCNGGERHKWMYDEISLKQSLVDAGFHDVKLQCPRTSYVSKWLDNNLDLDNENNISDPSGLFMEAKK